MQLEIMRGPPAGKGNENPFSIEIIFRVEEIAPYPYKLKL